MAIYNKELKLKIIEQYFAGRSATTLSKENKIGRKIIYTWIQKWYLQGEKGLVATRNKKYKNINTFLIHMNHSIWKYNNTRFHTIIKNTPEKYFNSFFSRV